MTTKQQLREAIARLREQRALRRYLRKNPPPKIDVMKDLRQALLAGFQAGVKGI